MVYLDPKGLTGCFRGSCDGTPVGSRRYNRSLSAPLRASTVSNNCETLCLPSWLKLKYSQYLVIKTLL